MKVRLRLSDPALADDLLDFLRRRDCPGDRVGEAMIEVRLPHEFDEKAGRAELDFYLYIWQSLHSWSTRINIVE